MKILMCNDVMNIIGGAEEHIRTLTTALQGQGHEVAWAIAHSDNHDYGVPIFPAIEIGIMGFRPDIVHLHNVYHDFAISAIKTIPQFPTVMSLHDYGLFCGYRIMAFKGSICPTCEKICNPGQHLNDKAGLRNAKALVTFNPYSAAILAQQGVSCRVIPHGISCPSELTDNWDKRNSTLFARAFSRYWYKGESIIDRVCDNFPTIKAYGVPHAQLMDMLGNVVVLLHTSIYQETFGLVTLEAWSKCTPVIAFDVAGSKAVIDNEKNGFLIPLGDETLLGYRIAQLLEDRKLSQQMGLAGYQKLKEVYTPQAMAEKYIALYKEIS